MHKRELHLPTDNPQRSARNIEPYNLYHAFMPLEIGNLLSLRLWLCAKHHDL